jgi:NAD(P)-dependent dehydrogenase (short-subunit alcohol dehydrogenase family)
MLASHGFTVFAGVRRVADGEALVAASTGTVIPVLIDVTDAAQIAAAASLIARHVGDAGLQGLVNNAGVAVAAPLEFLPIDQLRQQFDINVVGQVAVTQGLLPLLRLGRGRIVNMSSIGGLLAGGMLGAYHASKFALEAITDTLRAELKPWGIEVIAVEPGQISTPIWSTSAARSDSILESIPGATELYGERIERAKAAAIESERSGISPDRVAEAVLHALTAKRPKTRYPVGTDAKIGKALIAKLPDRLKTRLLAGRR